MRASLLFLLVFALPMSSALGQQTEREHHKTVADQFEKDYNAGNHESIFSSFAAVMQEALPIQETKKFFSDVKNGYGNIISREFLKYEHIATQYKTHCERGTFTLTLTIDTNNKISGLFIKPYMEINLPKMERTKTNLALPFKGEWAVVWGGDTSEQNYHVAAHPSQKHAFDFIMVLSNNF